MPKQQSTGGNGTASNSGPTLSKFQRFETREMDRAELRSAPYNPRQISDGAKLKLRETLERVGLVQPIVWNQRTGTVVGGHQRLKALDALEGSVNYRLTVAVVDVDEARERELNVLLNNSEVGGDWDLEKLQAIIDSEDVELENTGFDMADMIRLFGEAPSQAGTDHQKAMADQMNQVKDAYDALTASNADKADTHFYCVVVFESYDRRTEFLEKLGLPDDRYHDGRTLAGLVEALRGEIGLKEAELAAARAELLRLGVGQNEAVTPA